MAFNGVWKRLKSFVPKTDTTILFPLGRVIGSAV